MAIKTDQEQGSAANEGPARAAQRAARREARAKKQSTRTKKDGSERPTTLCSLATLSLKKDSKGYQIIGTAAERRQSISLANSQVGAMLNDLEAAIHVIRADAGAPRR